MEIEIIIPIVSAAIVIGTIVYHAKQVNQSKGATYATILTQTMRDVYELYRDEEKLQTKHECEVHVVRWLDCLAVVTNLYHKGKLKDKELLDFIEYDLTVAKRYMIWFDEHNLGKKYNSDANRIWTNLKLYFDDNSIKPASDETLPTPLKNFKDLP
ncbi:MAG: hypothetical protein HOD60_05430 [Candidatus Nitrosopelagicus sp.]|nr:hypothetical protein [Candidatus Nitrosopelagicus sp.]